MRTSSRAALVVPLVAALALAACSGGDPADDPSATDASGATDAADPVGAETDEAAPELPAPADLGDGVAATVGDVEIAVAELDEMLAPRGLDSTTAEITTVRGTLTQLVQVQLVSQAAEDELGLDLDDVVTDEAVAARTDQFIEDQGGEETWEAIVTQQGIEADAARDVAAQEARIQLLVEAIREQVAADLTADQFDEDAVRDAFAADPSGYQSSDVAHILLDTEQEALDALARLDDGEDFGELAVELSTGPSGPNGGELGVNPRGTYVQEFQDAVYADTTVPGEVVGPVETQFGFHLILVNEIITPDVEEVVAQERASASGPAFQAFVTAAFDARPVVVDDDFGVWDALSSSVVAPAS